MPITPRKCTREEIEADPRWRAAIKPLFLLMYELGVEHVGLTKDGKQCHSSITPERDRSLCTVCGSAAATLVLADGDGACRPCFEAMAEDERDQDDDPANDDPYGDFLCRNGG